MRLPVRIGVACLLGALGLFLGSGCASQAFLTSLPDWPEEQWGRKLYKTEHAYIYASNPNAAREIAALVNAVATDFAAETGGQLSPLLLILSDAQDRPVFVHLKEIPAVRRQIAAMHNSKDGFEGEQDEESKEEWKKVDRLEADLGRFGLTMEMLVKAWPISCALVFAAWDGLLKNSAEPPTYAVFLSTESLIRQTVKQGVQAFLKTQSLGLLERIAIAPFAGSVERTATDFFLALRETELFGCWAEEQANWSEDAKEEKSRAYFQRKMSKILGEATVKFTKKPARPAPPTE